MTTTVAQAGNTGQMRRRPVAGRKLVDRLVKVSSWIAAWFGIFVMGFLVYEVIKRGIVAINWDFFTQPTPQDATMTSGGGMANAIVGTLVITLCAALMAIPTGFLGGVYLAEFGRNGRVATMVRMVANVIMGVPSIVVGVFAFGIIVKPVQHYSGFAGSVALAFIMLPVMARTTEDILNLVPNELRESGLAMGAPRWKVTLGVICRAARGGLITGATLAIVRVAGETAPLLFTALSSPYWMTGLFGPGGFFGGPVANLTKTMFDFSGSPYSYWVQLAWGGALVIIVAVLGMNILVRLLFQRGKEW
ncbi:MAG TPA: phosphate ABC transporter permease PstA [Thermoleophilia bacterium]|nr:phosphate ABC transporter permease PstA [Thermoleophilia bacterium]